MMEKAIETLLKGSFKGEGMISLHRLIWTIDARFHATPTPEEFNTAAEAIGGIEKSENEKGVWIKPGRGNQTMKINQADIDKAMVHYNNMIKGWLE